MYKPLLSLSVLLLGMLSASLSFAQCDLNPTITPTDLMLCPGAKDTLWTQAYDTYQWYRYLKFGENPQIDTIEGATEQYLVVDQYEDAAYTFKVAVTKDTCAAESPGVLVDGWAFLPISITMSGSYGQDPETGILVLCDTSGTFWRDSLVMVVNQPYKHNIQWFMNGDSIPGATDDTLVVWESGEYTVQGYTEQCPDFSQMSLPIPVEFRQPPRPVIQRYGDTLRVTNADSLVELQWYLNGDSIPDATTASYVPTTSGTYTVSAAAHVCYGMSFPYVFDITTAAPDYLSAPIRLYPNPARSTLTIEAPLPLHARITNLAGQVLLQSDAPTLDISTLAAGVYFVRLADRNGLPVKVEKLVVAH